MRCSKIRIRILIRDFQDELVIVYQHVTVP